MKVGALMTRDVICVSQDESLDEVWRTMTEFKIRHVPVFEGDTLVGIVSDRDVLLHATPGAVGPVVPMKAVREVMTPVPITARPRATIGEIAALMQNHRIDCVPITEGAHRLVGLVTSHDLIGLLNDRDDESARVLPFEWRVLRGGATANG
jgi:CBS domain-containing protein